MTEELIYKEKSVFEELSYDVQQGIEGKGLFVPIGLEKLGKYANIRQKMMTLLFSSTGAGKSSLCDTAFILNPYEHLLSTNNVNNIKMNTILFSMERAKKYRIAKWIMRKIFLDHNVKIELPKLMGFWDEKLNKDEHDLFLMYEDYISALEEEIDIYEGPKSPSEIYKICKDIFRTNGKYEKTGKDKEVYIANDPNVIYNIIIDHGNLTKINKDFPNKKAAIDGLSGMAQGFRDKESAHVLWVSQVNRDMASPLAQKSETAELNLDHVKASGDVGDACDIAISLFDPIKYNQASRTKYNPVDFVDRQDGSKYFRSATIVKSSYGADDTRIPLSFNGFCGDFAELPRRDDLSDEQYHSLVQSVLSGEYFRNREELKYNTKPRLLL